MSRKHIDMPVKATQQIDLEAASWIAQLDNGKISPRDQLALAEWMARSPKHHQTIKHMAKLWGRVDKVLDDAIALNSNLSLWAVIKSSISARPLSFAASAAVALSFIMAFSFMFLPGLAVKEPSNYNVYQVAKGENTAHILSDGSTVHLNTDTLVEVQYTKNIRTLRLLRGEAFFEVSPDASRPFHVYAGGSRVAAIGTAFSVKLDGASVDVIVSEGKIRFDRVEEISGKTLEQVEKNVKVDTPVYMEAGQSMKFENQVQKVVEIDQNLLEKKFAWQKGEMVFSGDSLETVVDEMNRYSSKTIVISDRNLRSVLVSGTFKSDDIPAILDALEVTMGIKVDDEARNIIYLSE